MTKTLYGIKVDKIMQVEKTLIGKSFAKLNDETFAQVVKELVKLISK
ncbi:hypothetical protein HY988_06085 [Candidatus Micrarchaeota archaeon]|nr:hypothetical protein [Candidatus Micrarchaeota archaeon]